MALKQFGLSAFEKLKSRKEIKRVISFGVNIISDDKKIKAIYLTEKTEKKTSVKITPAVFKKLGCAVWRNRIKRLIRESYRLNKKDLIQKSNQKKIDLKIIFSPQNINENKNKHIGLEEILPSMLDVMKKITVRI
ncbi:MAG: hypothetical protein CO128_02575 [Ignavibacteriales bacterium CG_4_9_14_3_um_filter_30_11]|nr:MAG: hypothetical protein CO128_02575 [Ignavibacteriales bacterium CG_4_9_14_3_um_filter_30_11]